LQVGKDLSLLSGVSEKQIKTEIDRYTSNSNNRNIDRVYDELSANEIDTIFKLIEKTKETLNGKSGLEDCLEDGSLRISTEQEAMRVVKETVLDKEKTIDETEQQK
jgi:hypothetical protein